MTDKNGKTDKTDKPPTFEEVWMEGETSDPVAPLVDATRKAREAAGADFAEFARVSSEIEKEGAKK